jgi:hypothetical protein
MYVVVMAMTGLAAAGIMPVAHAPAAVADSPDLQPGVSVRLNDFDEVTPTTPEHAAHPGLELVSVMAPWKALEPTRQHLDPAAMATLDADIHDARDGGYQIILRIMAGRLEPGWLVNDSATTKAQLLGTDVNATDYCDRHDVVVPWDPVLKSEYTWLMDQMGQWMQQSDGAGGTKGDHVFSVPVAMPSFQGTEMNWGYGNGTAICPSGTDGAGQDLDATNRAAWDAIDPGTATPVSQREAERRSLTKQAWKDAIDLHMAELPAGVDSSIAYGALFGDGQAAALEIASQKVAQYPTRLWSMTTNLQPEVFTDGSLGTYRQWCQACYNVMMEVTAAHGLLGFQTASVNINDTSAKYHAALEDGLATYGMRFLETQPDNITDYYPYLVTDAASVQTRIRGVNHQRTTTTSVACDAVTLGHATTCHATVADVDAGAKVAPGGARTVTWPANGAFAPQTCTLGGSGSSPSCDSVFTPTAAGTQPVTATYAGDSNHTGSSGTLQLDVAKRTSQSNVTCADASVAVGVATTCTVTVSDVSTPPGGSAPTGQVAWTTDGSGAFAPASCTLVAGTGNSASCQASYTGASTGNSVGLTATYAGGNRHTGSSGSATVRIAKRSATTAVSCQSPILVGSASTCTATVADSDSGSKTTPSGTVAWSGGGTGVSPASCTLSGTGSQASCSVTYTPSAAGTVTLTADYPGDATHVGGAASTNVTGTLRQISTSVRCDSSVVVGSPATCTATVTDIDGGTSSTPSGTVGWSAGGQGAFSATSCTLAGAGAAASCSVTFTPSASGTPTVTASYGGDQRHTSGIGSTQITGTARSTSLLVACDTPVLVGSGSTCTATVRDTDSGTAVTPVGQVSWSTGGSGAFSAQTCALSGSAGVGTCSVTYTPAVAGAHSVGASYGGSQQHGSSSGSSQLSATARQTSTVVACDTPVPVGTATRCTATVTDSDTGPASTPTGNVTWSHGVGSFSSTSCALSGSGAVASCSVTYSRSTTGGDTLVASYAGDARHLSSGGEANIQTAKRSTSTSVACQTPIMMGSTSTCTATVTDTDAAPAITPTGDVTWSTDGTGSFGPSTCTLAGASVATCSVTYTPADAGTAGITATYGGDARHTTSTGGGTVRSVVRLTSTSVDCSASLLVGSTASCTVTVTDTSSASPTTPAGTVHWSSNASGIFSATDCTPTGTGASSTCTVTYVPSGAGNHTVTADYAGDADHGSSSGTDQISVALRDTTTSVACTSPIALGASSTCTATVKDTSPGTAITPSGAVHWFPGGTEEFSNDTCSLTGAGSTSTCSVTYTPATAGAHDIGATYGGTGTHATSAGSGQVTANAPPSIALRSSAFAANAVGNNLVLPTPAGVQTGDVMLAVVAVRSNPTVTPPAGWNLVTATVNGSNLRQLSYTRVATAGEPSSYRWGFNQNRAASGSILAYTGVSTATPVETFSGGTGSSATITAPSATTTSNGAMVVGAFSIANGATVTPPAGMTERGEVASSTKIRTEVADGLQRTAGPTGARSATATSSGANVGQLLVLHPSGGGGGGGTDRDPTFDQNLPDRSDAQGAAISLSAHATDPDNDPLTYSATGLPPGLSINAGTGLISGTISSTAAAGSPYAVSVRVSDDGGATVGAVDTFAWTVTSTGGGGGGSVTFRASAFAANATVNNLVISKPAGVQAGDVMGAVVDVKVNPTITAPTGWALVSTNSNGSELTQKIYTHVAGAAEPTTYRWSFNENRAATGAILAYSGVSTSSPVEVTSVGKAVSAGITAPSVTTASGTIVVGAFSINNASAIAEPAGTTERGEIASSTKIKTEVADFVQSAAGATGAKIAQAASSGTNIGQLIVLRPA